jgi:hypothetical protein
MHGKPLMVTAVARLMRHLLVALLTLVSFSSSLLADLAAPMRAVEAVRQLEFTGPVEQRSIDRGELRRHLLKEMGRSTAGVDDYLAILELAQLVEPDPALLDQLFELYEAQVLAFYDPRERIYYSLNQPPAGLEANETMERMVVIHELVHALQDQRFSIGEAMERFERNWEQQLAYHAVIEGEATLVMLAEMLGQLGQPLESIISNEAAFDGMAALARSESAGTAAAPRYFVESMMFPYVEGLRFVAHAFRMGGWDAVSALHLNPPRSTAEVLDPALYQQRVATGSAGIALPEPEGATYSTPVGAFFWRFLLGDDAPLPAASRFTAMKDGKGRWTALVEATGEELEAFSAEYAELLRSRGVKAQIDLRGERLRIGYGADAKLIRRFIREK